ncbi:hypothetical protein BD769DRAFT_1420093, partial [Suillus cothurnatus]
MCHQCYSALVCKHPHQPVNALANFQYYGHECLPSVITHFYSYKPNGVNGHHHWFDEETSQRYNQGNVGIRPLDSVELHELLLPSHDELRDAMCVIFTGHAQKPTRETVKWINLY